MAGEVNIQVNNYNLDSLNRGVQDIPVAVIKREMDAGVQLLGPPIQANPNDSLWQGISNGGCVGNGKHYGFMNKPDISPMQMFKEILSRLRNPANSNQSIDDLLAQFNRPSNNSAMDYFNSIFQKQNQPNDPISRAAAEIRATGQPGSRTVKVGKKKYKVSVDAGGNVSVKRKKGFLGKLGGLLKKALPFVKTLANFIPGVGPFISKGLDLIDKFVGKLPGPIRDLASGFVDKLGFRDAFNFTPKA